MGWFLRKAIKVGPLRLNLSKSGLGVSAVVKGFRVSRGPRGTHLFAGRHGLYFRERLDGPGSARGREERLPPGLGDTDMREIRTADVARLIGPDSKAFIRALMERHQRVALFPVVLLLGVAAFSVAAALALSASAWWWLAFACIVSGTYAGGWFVHERDLERKTIQVDYEMDSGERTVWSELERALLAIGACRRVWQRTAERQVRERKYHAGASSVIRRDSVRIRRATPPYFKSNVPLVAMHVRGQTLYWTPRYVLVYQGSRVGLVRYRDVEVSLETTRFVEEEGVPGDARVVDRTWRYVNKSGGPDRRFSNNSEIPVCLYSEATLRSSAGLHVELMLSRVGAADALAPALAAIVQYRQALASQRTAMPDAMPGAIVFHCHSCGRCFRVRDQLAGKTATCKSCGASLIVPSRN